MISEIYHSLFTIETCIRKTGKRAAAAVSAATALSVFICGVSAQAAADPSVAVMASADPSVAVMAAADPSVAVMAPADPSVAVWVTGGPTAQTPAHGQTAQPAEAAEEEIDPSAEVPLTAAAPLENGTYLLPNGEIFDPAYYGASNQDVIRKYGSDPIILLWHYQNYGIAEGRLPSYPITETDENGNLLSPEQTKDGQTAMAASEAADARYHVIGSGDPIRLLFLGNSITKYGYNELWWGYWGMGASRRDRDYYHRLIKLLAKDHTVTSDIRNFAFWESPEVFGITRDATLPLLDGYLSNPYDVVVIQLGENISNAANLEEEYSHLVEYIRAYQPAAQIILVGDFWPNAPVEKTEKALVRKYGFDYVDLKDLQTQKYMIGVGAVVAGDDGRTHRISNSGVAMHPNDEAMGVIASRLYTVISRYRAAHQ
ncbi:MAG: SGNH/GDSL hydrolase family protein [Lachnospiraceae bacterium]|nr:SGNH/GDSL hydrolase family protein [Lachnospiraceae bacterium]